MKKNVAVIIPNYNKAMWIKACIESVLAQTYPYLEIIVIDDHSTDNSVSVIKDNFGNTDKVHLFELPQNKGVSFARNFGVNQTNADFIIFLDSDDVYCNPKKVENEVRNAAENTVSFSQWVPMDIQGNILPYEKYNDNPYRNDFAISKILSTKMPIAKQLRGYMIPRELFLTVGGYDISMNLFEDFDLQCRLALNCNFKYSKEIGEAYRIGTGGLSSKGIKDANKTICEIQKKYYKELTIHQKIVYLYYFYKNNNKLYFALQVIKGKILKIRKGKAK